MSQEEKLNRCQEVFGDTGRSVFESINDISPRSVNHIHDYLANNLYEDNTLDSKPRELCVLSIISAQGGLDKALAVHIKTALKHGASKNEIVAVLETVGSYAGMPKSLLGLLVAKSVFEEE